MFGMDNIFFYLWCLFLFKVCVTDGTTVAPFQTQQFRIPSCERNGVFLRVNELEPVGHVVYKVNCTDDDGDKLNYVIERGNKFGKFLINQTGHVKLAKTLNSDYYHKYYLGITVSEETEKRFSTSVTLAISVINSNDNVPVIENLKPVLSIPENTPIGTIIATCTVTDKDDKKGALVGKTIVKLKKTDVATIDSSTCDIYLNTELNYEEKRVHYIEVIASDRDPVSPRTTSQLMKINVEDVNDNPPKCNEYYLVKIREDQAINTSIEIIQCSDADSGTNSTLSYKISDDNDENVKTTFQVNAVGEFYLQQRVDYETRYLYGVRVDVYDDGNPSLTTSVLVSVVVSDVDDNIPTWPTSIRQESVNETLSVGTIVFVMTATDEDDSNSTTSKITYTRESITKDWFDIIRSTGVVKITRPLDWTIEHHVIMNISAHSSNRVSAKSFIIVNITIIDFNNIAPVFNRDIYTVFVKEGTPVGTSISRVKAFDPENGDNGRFSYGINGTIIAVNSSSGVISLLQPLKYSREAIVTNLQLTARDFGEPALTGYSKLLLTVLSSNSTIRVTNDGPIDAHLDELCMDGNVTLGICVERNTACEVLNLGQKGYCRCARGLVKTYEDGLASCESPPNRIFEDTVRTVYVDGLRQIDISYYIPKKYAHTSHKLTLFPNSGGIKTTFGNSTIRLDLRNASFDTSKRFMMRMSAQIDKTLIGDSMLLELIKETNSTTEHREVMENATENTAVYELNDAYKNYELVNCSSNFAIQNDKRIVTKGKLDSETNNVHVCIVKGYPNDNISCILEEVVKVYVDVIDVNDNPPIFISTSYVGDIREKEPTGTTVKFQSPISSSDRDISGNDVNYTIVGGHSEFFRLEKIKDSREVKIKSTKVLEREAFDGENRLDPEVRNSYYLSIEAFDGENRSPVVNVTIDVLDVDDPPVFTQDIYNFNISEKGDDSLVGNVSAVDYDEEENKRVLYRIKSGAFGKFRIDPINGSVYMNGDIASNNNTAYEFIVYATNENATARVRVLVTDINESPEFKTPFVFYVSEDSGEVNIGTITASDPDFGINSILNYSVIGSDPMRNFSFPNPNHGTLVIHGGLDYEKNKELKVYVKAVDGGGKSATTTVSVQVLDINDNAPIPVNTSFSANISSRSLLGKPGKPVLIIDASDADSGENGRLFYSIVDNNDGVFSMSNGAEGVVLVNRTGSTYKQMYQFRVKISDRGTPPKSTLVNVSIRVENTTSELRFKVNSLYLFLAEQSYNDTVLVEDMALYLENQNGKSVSFGSDLGAFTGIELLENGTLKMTKTIDREEQEVYRLLVYVKDGNSSKTSDIILVIFQVNDTNDNPPEVDETQIAATDVYENADIGDLVILVNVTDADKDNVFEFSILNKSVPFRFDEDGSLLVSGKLDKENVSNYTLLIMISDGVNNITLSMIIHVLDVDDNPLVLSPTAIDINETQTPQVKISFIYFFDADSPKSPLKLSITNEDCPINITQSDIATERSANTTVEVSLKRRIDYETKKHHVCNITAEDDGKSSTYALNVTVLDENDNAPQIINFTEKTINLTVEDSPGKIIIQGISATDADSGENGEIFFSFLDPNKDPFDKFAINETTGQITIASVLSNVERVEYDMVIVASDRGDKPKTSTVVCTINFTIPIHFPKIYSNSQPYKVYENKVNVSLDNLKIFDEGVQCETCKFVLDDEYVSISTRGNLSLKKSLDYESFTTYMFYVRAEDNDVPTNTAIEQFTISVKDENEYEHSCGINIFDNSEEEKILGSVNVTDEDGTSEYKYEITNSICSNKISVNSQSGLITIDSNPIRKENCTMEVRISDRFRVNCSVELTIFPTNVHAPQFTQDTYETTLPVNAKEGHRMIIFNFKANDSDGDSVMYLFAEQPQSYPNFKIDPNSGILNLTSDLDVEETVAAITIIIIAVDGAKKPKTGTTTVEILLTGRVCLKEEVYDTQKETSTLFQILFYTILSFLCVFIVLFILACFKWQTLKRQEKISKSKKYYTTSEANRYNVPMDSSDNIFSRVAPYRGLNTDQAFSTSAVHWNNTYEGLESSPKRMDFNSL